MLIEGKGWVVPKPVDVEISQADLERLRTFAVKLAEFRRYRYSDDQWKRGLVDNQILYGLLGEQVLAGYLNRHLRTRLQVDTELMKSGDGGKDFNVFGYRIQVKNRRGGPDYLERREMPVITRGTLGKLLKINADIFVKTSAPARGADDMRVATADGWLRANGLVHAGRFKAARMGRHMNLEVADRLLLPMPQLVEYLKSHRPEATCGH